jgi:hypothetical protein
MIPAPPVNNMAELIMNRCMTVVFVAKELVFE